MTDIVDRLRREVVWESEVGDVLNAAADEIEQLRKEIKRLQDLTAIASRPLVVGGSDRVAQAFQKLQKLKQEAAQTATAELKGLTERLTQIDRALE
jgi:cell division septum initiation protein DivIVA